MTNSQPSGLEPRGNFMRMFPQSLAVLTRPTVATFERYERSGGTAQAYLYVLIAALVSGAVAGFFAIFRRDLSTLGQFTARALVIMVGFAVFTGLVYLISRSVYRATGTYSEVAYTFALFYVPLSLVATVLGIVPLLGQLANIVVAILLILLGYVAVQSSTNVRASTPAMITLAVSGILYYVVSRLLATYLLNTLVLNGLRF